MDTLNGGNGEDIIPDGDDEETAPAEIAVEE
jgi:hypothetical protein